METNGRTVTEEEGKHTQPRFIPLGSPEHPPSSAITAGISSFSQHQLIRQVITPATVIPLSNEFMLHYSITERNIAFALFNQRRHWFALCH